MDFFFRHSFGFILNIATDPETPTGLQEREGSKTKGDAGCGWVLVVEGRRLPS